MKCGWMQNGFMSVNMHLGAGRAFMRSLYQQYADWGVDFVKNDCVFGDDLNIDEIKFVSQLLNEFSRPILYSLSPGTSASPSMAKDINGLVNMYRVTGDDWDTWGDVSSHFNVARDFAAAKMIGAKGLKGTSWPDLDMLPLGWLTDPGSNDGPHRNCRLSIDEQRTQMTLWSMAKSPLMFGGDMRNLDETTFSLITNPTLLKINSFSSNNMEFPYITGAKHQEFRRYALANQVESYKVVDGLESEDRFLGMTSCRDVNANGWSAEAYDDELEKVCWKENSPSEQQAPFCLYKRKLLLESDGNMMSNKNSRCKLHLLATERREFCLGVSPNRKLASKEFRRGSFLPCRRDANQMWELSHNGTLKSHYSGLCASVNAIKANEGEVRSWIATGTQGEIYLAFFNLNPEAHTISTEISDIGKALPGGKVYSDCKTTEVWTAKDFGVVTKMISMVVPPHGCALFTLHCT
ncbi:OLC1v1028446C2 [Oldenlandia corymbosa var. corymbosa]|nr:OLC1v1028446C2 [Oldenlandia corymbosa var. corymbosa]